ncbi:TonB-dependent receptor [Hephaestia mangrovi]|uniref:TonB-dependent receptor n=1 Tax=Hephaestia mangrovi TaxID=2873268 RepID=UPI001CA61E60|nr:TonB-dependent receptor [Hephaestia mangrovi]MBY8827484.1 TonB-dependent receptor [Hephaestia mangrovi]
MKKFELLAASAIALLSAAPALAQTDTATAPTQTEPAPDTTAATGQTQQEAGGIQDIVVTAERQSERLQDVPIAVSAFTAQNLQQQQIVNPAALQQSLPNVSFTKTNFTSSSFTIRGIGDLCTGTSCDSATAIHVNDMPLVSTRLFESEFYDLERIEVLRGPQGTLFGRNATSGVVNFITAKPDLSGIHANGEFEYGNFDSKKAKGMFNLPLGDTLGVRVAGLWLNRGGFTTNDYDGKDIDGRKLYSVRGTLSWEPDSDTRLDLIGYYFHEKDDRARIQKQLCHRDPTGILGCLPDRLTNDVTNGNSTLASIQSSSEFLSIAGNPGLAPLGLGSVYGTDFFADAANPANLRHVNEDFNPTYYAQEQQYQAKFFHSFGKIDLNLTGGYASNKVDSRTDYTMAVESPLTNNPGLETLQTLASLPAAALPLLGFAPGLTTNPFTGLANVLIPNGAAGGVCQSDASKNDGGVYSGASIGCYDRSIDFDRSQANYKQWSVEAHVASHFDGMFNFLLGGIYLDQKTTNNAYYVNSFGLDYTSGLLAAAAAASGAAPPGLVFATPFYNNDEAKFRLKSYGIFGETYFEFNDKLKLTLGLRYNHDQKYLKARTTYLVDAAGANPALPYGATDLSQALNYAGLDFDSTLPGVQPWAETNVSFGRLTGRAVLDYKISRNNLLYASYSRGYKSGGINPPLSPVFAVPTAFKPESINAYEIGSKNTFLDGTLQLNLTGFYYDYKNLQLARIVARTAVNDNVNAKIYGIEAEAIISPTPDFVVNANFSWLKSKVSGDTYLANPRDPSGGRTDAVIIKDITNASNCAVYSAAGSAAAAQAYVDTINGAIGTSIGEPGILQPATQVLPNGTYGAYSICDQLEENAGTVGALFGGINFEGSGVPVNVKGNKLPQAPSYKFAVGAQYTFHTASDWTIVPRVDLNYTGNSYASIFNQPIDRLPGYEVVNAQLTVNGPDNKWYVRGFVKNLTNDNAITGQYVTDQSSGLFTNVFTIEPRQYGVAVGFNF